MLRAVVPVRQVGTAGILARSFCFIWHVCHRVYKKEQTPGERKKSPGVRKRGWAIGREHGIREKDDENPDTATDIAQDKTISDFRGMLIHTVKQSGMAISIYTAAGCSHAKPPSVLWVARNAANKSTAPRTGRRAGVRRSVAVMLSGLCAPRTRKMKRSAAADFTPQRRSSIHSSQHTL